MGVVDSNHTELVGRVRRELLEAGFGLADGTDDDTPGMRVVHVPAGARVYWTPLGGSAELPGLPAGSGGNTRSAVFTAVRAVLTMHGHTVVATSETSDLIVLPSPRTDR
ncbi:hypothetical protein ACLQ2E_27955 [Streptomyces lavendulocolor]